MLSVRVLAILLPSMDLAFDGSVAIFFNRKVVLEFLHSLVSTPGADNKLERFNWRALKCNEEVGALRVNTLYKYIFSEPVRWLAGKADTLNDWSLNDSAEVLDLVEHMFIEIAADGHTLLDPSFDPFESIAQEQPAFHEYREQRMQQTVKAADGTKHAVHAKVLSEARSPAGAGMRRPPSRWWRSLRKWPTLRWSRCATQSVPSPPFSPASMVRTPGARTRLGMQRPPALM